MDTGMSSQGSDCPLASEEAASSQESQGSLHSLLPSAFLAMEGAKKSGPRFPPEERLPVLSKKDTGWEHAFTVEGEQNTYFCRLCEKGFRGDVTGNLSLSSLRSHCGKFHSGTAAGAWAESKDRKQQQRQNHRARGENQQTHMVGPAVSDAERKRLNDLVVKKLILGTPALPFELVEHQDFRDFLAQLRPGYNCLKSTQLVRRTDVLSKEIVEAGDNACRQHMRTGGPGGSPGKVRSKLGI